MKRWEATFPDSRTGEPVFMEVKLTLQGWLLYIVTHFSAHVLFYLPPVENFTYAMKRHTKFRLNGGPWVRYSDYARLLEEKGL